MSSIKKENMAERTKKQWLSAAPFSTYHMTMSRHQILSRPKKTHGLIRITPMHPTSELQGPSTSMPII